MEIYGRVRRAVRVEGRSQRAVAREFGLSRETVRKMLQYAVPPGYQRQQPVSGPSWGRGWASIDAILEDDKQRPAEAAAHGQADLRAAEGRARLHRRLHDREGLRAQAKLRGAGDVRAADASSRARRRRTSAKRWW